MAAPLVRVAPADGFDITAPLLDPEIQANASGPSASNGVVWTVTPLPKLQVFLISYASLSEPVTVNFVYPFINERIAALSSSPVELAHRTGILFGCFSFAQFCLVFFWGSASDRVGRKPILLLCLFGCAISTLAFGVSTTFVQILIFRSITGACYGDVPVVRSAMGDVTDSTNQARAFSFIPLCWAIGSTVAPLIGGFLSHPAKRFPQYIGRSEFFIRHPYALPSFVAALVSATGFLFIALFLRETLKPLQSLAGDKTPDTEGHLRDNGTKGGIVQSYGATSASRSISPSEDVAAYSSPPTSQETSREFTPPISNPLPHLSAWQILQDSIVRNVLISYGLLAMISTSNDVIFALWMYLPVKDGGIGLSAAQIATALSIGSTMSTFVITVMFPWLHRRHGTLQIYRYAMSMDVILALLYPLVSLIALLAYKHPNDSLMGTDKSSSVPLIVILGVGSMLVVKALASLTWGCNMLLVTASAPSAHTLGAVNSLGQMVASLSRAVGPPLYSSIFAVSMGTSAFGGKGLIWIFMSIMALFSFLMTFRVKEGHQEWRRTARG